MDMFCTRPLYLIAGFMDQHKNFSATPPVYSAWKTLVVLKLGSNIVILDVPADVFFPCLKVSPSQFFSDSNYVAESYSLVNLHSLAKPHIGSGHSSGKIARIILLLYLHV